MRNEAPPRIVGKDFRQVLEKVKPSFEEEYWGKEPIVGIGVGMEITRRGNQRFVINVYLSEELNPEHSLKLPKMFKGVPVRSAVSGIFRAAGS